MKKIKTYIKNPISCYIFFSIFSLFLLLSLFFISHGDYINNFFYWDIRDTGMDFFHSIEFLHGNNPYQAFRTLYPPLANLFFKFVYSFMPTSTTNHFSYKYVIGTYLRATSYDSRTYQSMMMSFIIAIIMFVIILSYIVGKYFKKENNNVKHLLLISFITSYGVINAIERGNIIFFVLVMLISFTELRKSPNKLEKELSIILLAIAAGLKLYPAVYGILLLRDRNITLSIRAIIYGLLSVAIPMLFFKGGYLENFKTWFGVLFNFAGGTSRMDILLEALIDLPIPIYIMPIHMTILEYMIIFEMLIGVFLEEKEYLVYLYLSIIIYLVNGDALYSFIYFVIPLFNFLRQEIKLDYSNVFPFAVLLLLTLPSPIFEMSDKVLITSLIIFVLAIYCGLRILYKFYQLYKKIINRKSN